jgi:hypothetical protein
MDSVYALLSAYLIACSLILSIKAFTAVLGIDGSVGDKLKNLFNSTNGVLVAALLSTIGEWQWQGDGIRLMSRYLPLGIVALRASGCRHGARRHVEIELTCSATRGTCFTLSRNTW